MEKTFLSLLRDFIEENGRKILDQPEQFRALFLDFSQNEFRAEAQIFSQFLDSKQAAELRNSDDVDLVFLRISADRFQQDHLFDKGVCNMVVFAYARFRGLISQADFQAALSGEAAPPKEARVVEVAPTIPVRESVVPLTPAVDAPKEKSTEAPAKKKGKAKWIAVAAIVVVVVLLVAVLPTIISANVEDFEFDGTAITKYIGNASEVQIPSTIRNRPVTSIGEGAFFLCRGLTSITIPDSVTSIGERAFFDCSGLSATSRAAIRRRFGDKVF
jgi:hypothetical protein